MRQISELLKGLTFNNFWSNPVCSPTRASLLTGRYGYRTNVKGASDILSPSETSLQKYINDNNPYGEGEYMFIQIGVVTLHTKVSVLKWKN